MKKIILTRKQLSEIIGADFSYLDDNNDSFSYYNNNSEIVTADQMSNDNDGDPIITDKFAKQLAPRYFYGHRDVRGSISCSTEHKESHINESNKDLEYKTFKIPDSLYSYLKNILKKCTNKQSKGYKRLTNLINNRCISTNEMYQLKNNMENNSIGSDEYELIGGDKLKNWIDKELNKATSISLNSKNAKRQSGMQNAFIKSHDKEYGNNGAHSTISKNIEKDVIFNYE